MAQAMLHFPNCIQLKITHVKCSFKTGKKQSLQDLFYRLVCKNSVVAKHSNFITIRDTFTYCIFASGHINITGIPDKLLTGYAVRKCERLLDLKHRKRKVKIDNITATARFIHRVDIRRLAVSQRPGFRFSLNLEIFPGLYAKHTDATVLVFATGKLVVIGAKDYNRILCVLKELWIHILETNLFQLQKQQEQQEQQGSQACADMPIV